MPKRKLYRTKIRKSVSVKRGKVKRLPQKKTEHLKLHEETPAYHTNGNGHSKKLTFVDLFCGAGGFSKGFEMAGFTSIWSNDVEEVFCNTYKTNHPQSIVYCGDIRKITIEELRTQIGAQTVDVVIGGPPCQGFSHAGNRDPKDPRNSLFMEFVRMVDGLKPAYFVMENVPGILTMTTGTGQKVVEIIEGEFKRIGYHVQKKILKASNYGVPQIRRRVVFIGSALFPITFPEPSHAEHQSEDLFGAKIKKWVPVKEILLKEKDVPENYFHSPRMIEGFVKRRERNRNRGAGFGWQILDPEKPSYTISARYWKDGSDALVKYSDTRIRMLTQRECARIQTFPEDYKFCGSKRQQYTQIGNAVPALLAKAIAEKIKPYLK